MKPAIALILLTVATTAHASTIVAPAVVEQGAIDAYPGASHPDFYHMIFVVNGASVPVFPGNPGVDGVERTAYQLTIEAFVAGLMPDWNGVDVAWRPFMSGTGKSVKNHMNIQGPVFNMQGELVAPDAHTLFFASGGGLVNPINYGPNGGLLPPGTPVLSGTANGSGNGNDCGNWENTSSSFSGVSYSTTTLYDGSGGNCGQGGAIIGVSEPIPWPQAVPEPTSLALSAIGLLVMSMSYRRRRRA